MPEQPHVTRIPWFTSADLTDEQRALHATLVSTRRPGIADEDGRLIGPYNFFLLHPNLSTKIEPLGTALRFRGILPDQAREVVILLVARTEGSPFIWRAHVRLASSLGVDAHQLKALEDSGTLEDFDGDVFAIGALATELLSTGDPSDDAYEAARSFVGSDGILELVVLINYYRMAAMGLRLFGAPGE